MSDLGRLMAGTEQMGRREALAPVRHWTPARKLRLIAAIARGVVGREEAFAAHGLSGEEFAAWVRGAGARGLDGLRARRRLRAGVERALDPRVG